MANKTINALAFCPFFVTEAKRSITCEGIIGKTVVNYFETEREKVAHENNFCTGRCCKGCAVHSAIMQNYIQCPQMSSTHDLRC